MFSSPPQSQTYTPIGSSTTSPAVQQVQSQGNSMTPPAVQQGQVQSGNATSPVAQQVQSQGRNNDSMLVHMTPGEVSGLQNLAMAHGGSLTINPETGLPEAGFLEDILPTILGIGLSFIPGVGPLMAAGITGIGTTAVTGSLEKGLMAGLGAFGGASLAGAMGIGAAGAGAAGSVAGAAPISTVASAAANPAAAAALPGLADASMVATNTAGLGAKLGTNAIIGSGGLNPALLGSGAGNFISGVASPTAAQIGNASLGGVGELAGTLSGGFGTSVLPNIGATTVDAGLTNVAGNAATAFSTPTTMLGKTFGMGAEQFGNRFAEAAGRPLMGSGASVPTALKTGAAASGLAMPIMSALSPTYKPVGTPEEKSNYDGPYLPAPRTARFRGKGHPYGDSSEFQYFDVVNPYPNIVKAPKPGDPDYNVGYADGGEVERVTGVPEDFAQRIAAAFPVGGAPGTGPMGSTAAPPSAATAPISRAIVRPPADYRAGRGAEHNWNFKPVAPSAAMTASRISQDIGELGQYNPGVARQGAMVNNPMMGAPLAAAPQGRYRFDAATQSLIDVGEANPQLLAEGGLALEDGAFVVDARTVSELGNGSSSAGQELLARMGGQPIRGSGDGVSDSVHARIGGTQEARVARDEVHFAPQAVKRLGGGSPKRGADKLYSLMNKAHAARKKAKRGEDTGLRALLGAQK